MPTPSNADLIRALAETGRDMGASADQMVAAALTILAQAARHTGTTSADHIQEATRMAKALVDGVAATGTVRFDA